MTALDTIRRRDAFIETRRDALERLTTALSEALALRRKIDDMIIGNYATAHTRDYMRQLRFLCKDEMINLKSFVHLFSGTKTFMGFHQQFDMLLKYSRKMLKNQGRLTCVT